MGTKYQSSCGANPGPCFTLIRKFRLFLFKSSVSSK